MSVILFNSFHKFLVGLVEETLPFVIYVKGTKKRMGRKILIHLFLFICISKLPTLYTCTSTYGMKKQTVI